MLLHVYFAHLPLSLQKLGILSSDVQCISTSRTFSWNSCSVMADNDKKSHGEGIRTSADPTVAGIPTTGCGTLYNDSHTNHQSALTAMEFTGHKKKPTSFQITSVTVQGSRLSNDGGDDSADDLDESHTEDMSSDILDCSRTTDIDNDQLSEDNSNANSDLPTPPAPSIPFKPLPLESDNPTTVTVNVDVPLSVTVSVANATVSIEPSVVSSSVDTSNTSTVISANVPIMNPLPDQWHNRFKVVKIVSSEPFKRGRWLCMDFMDPPTVQATEVKQEILDQVVGSGTSTSSAESSGGSLASENPVSNTLAHVYEIPTNQTYPGSISVTVGPQIQQPLYGIILPISNASSNQGPQITMLHTLGIQASQIPTDTAQSQQTNLITQTPQPQANFTVQTSQQQTNFPGQTSQQHPPFTGQTLQLQQSQPQFAGQVLQQPNFPSQPQQQLPAPVQVQLPAPVQVQQQLPTAVQQQPQHQVLPQPVHQPPPQQNVHAAVQQQQHQVLSQPVHQQPPPQQQSVHAAVQQPQHQVLPQAVQQQQTVHTAVQQQTSHQVLPQTVHQQTQQNVHTAVQQQLPTVQTSVQPSVVAPPAAAPQPPSQQQALPPSQGIQTASAVQQQSQGMHIPSVPQPSQAPTQGALNLSSLLPNQLSSTLQSQSQQHQPLPVSQPPPVSTQVSLATNIPESSLGTTTQSANSQDANYHVPSQLPISSSNPETAALRISSNVNPPPLLEVLPETLNATNVVNGDDSESASGGASTVAIDNKIEQAMDLVKSHLMFAVREEVDVLKEKIAELMDRISQLEYENGFLRANASQDTLTQLSQAQQLQKPQQPQQPTPPITASSIQQHIQQVVAPSQQQATLQPTQQQQTSTS